MRAPLIWAAAAVAMGVLGCFPAVGSAQGVERSRFIATSDVLSQISMFTYREKRKSDLLFRATPVLSMGQGKARIEYEDGNAKISAEIKKMPPPSTLGPYTTYAFGRCSGEAREAYTR